MKGPTEGKKKTAQPSAWLKRQAVQITGMLPDDPNDARVVLGLSRQIVDHLDDGKEELPIVSLVSRDRDRPRKDR